MIATGVLIRKGRAWVVALNVAAIALFIELTLLPDAFAVLFASMDVIVLFALLRHRDWFQWTPEAAARGRRARGGPMTPAELAALTHRPDPGPHRTTITVDGQTVETLADLPPLRDRLLFVGLHPTPASVEAGHYHQGKLGATFWRRLMIAGVLPPGTPIETADDALLAAGHGITHLRKEPMAQDAASDADLTAGVGPLWQRVALWRPAAVVFINQRAASIAAGRPLRERWGHLDGVALGGRPCFLMPGAGRPGRGGRRGPQLPAQPRRLAAGSRLTVGLALQPAVRDFDQGRAGIHHVVVIGRPRTGPRRGRRSASPRRARPGRTR